MTRIATHALLIGILLLLLGCAGRNLNYTRGAASPELLNHQLTLAWEEMERIEGTLTLSVQNREFSGSLFGSVYLEFPNRLYLKLKAPFGIPIGEITIADGYYEASFATGQFEQGKIEEFDLHEATGIPLPAEDLLRIFEPMARPVEQFDRDDPTVSFEITTPDSLWQWRVAETNLEHQILYNPVKSWVNEERWFDSSTGNLSLFKRYKETVRIDNIPLSYDIYVESGGLYPTTLNVHFETLELNPEWTENHFQLRLTGG